MGFLNDSAIIASVISGIFMLISGAMALYTYRSKKKFKAKFDKELESHKSWLDRRNKEIQSQLDTKLELLRIEYGTVFTKRLEVIEEIYDRLLQVQEAYTIQSSHDKNKEMNEENVEKLKKISDNYNQFWDYFEKKKIYLSENLAAAIKFYLIAITIKIFDKYPERIKELNASEEQISAFKELSKSMAEEVALNPTEILNALENEFRTLIGVEVASKKV